MREFVCLFANEHRGVKDARGQRIIKNAGLVLGDCACAYFFGFGGGGGVRFAVGKLENGVWNFSYRAFRFWIVHGFEKELTRGKNPCIILFENNENFGEKMHGYRYILFDLDGTLILSHEGIFACAQHALQTLGKPRADEKKLRAFIGPVLEYSFKNLLGLNEEETKLAVKIYRERYREEGVYKTQPIEGALACLKALSSAGYILGLATSKPQVFAQMITARFGFSDYLTEQVGCGLDGSLRSKAEVLAKAVERLGADKEKCLMVGDRKYDLEGARAVGVDCALLRVGYGQEEEFADADFVFDGFDDLTKFLIQEEMR